MRNEEQRHRKGGMRREEKRREDEKGREDKTREGKGLKIRINMEEKIGQQRRRQ
jgi:hypothetical protein